jgi:acyl-coenzyme A synthetase/AMP-(fatty) acid ligase
MHIKNAFSLWSERNKYDWTLDLSLIENNNIKLINRKENRKSSSNIYSLEDLKQQMGQKANSLKAGKKKQDKIYVWRC